jgi:hypothetical protein
MGANCCHDNRRSAIRNRQLGFTLIELLVVVAGNQQQPLHKQ